MFITWRTLSFPFRPCKPLFRMRIIIRKIASLGLLPVWEISLCGWLPAACDEISITIFPPEHLKKVFITRAVLKFKNRFTFLNITYQSTQW